MTKQIKEKIELARKMFQALENNRTEQASEIARRTFCIQDRLATSP